MNQQVDEISSRQNDKLTKQQEGLNGKQVEWHVAKTAIWQNGTQLALTKRKLKH